MSKYLNAIIAMTQIAAASISENIDANYGSGRKHSKMSMPAKIWKKHKRKCKQQRKSRKK